MPAAAALIADIQTTENELASCIEYLPKADNPQKQNTRARNLLVEYAGRLEALQTFSDKTLGSELSRALESEIHCCKRKQRGFLKELRKVSSAAALLADIKITAKEFATCIQSLPSKVGDPQKQNIRARGLIAEHADILEALQNLSDNQLNSESSEALEAEIRCFKRQQSDLRTQLRKATLSSMERDRKELRNYSTSATGGISRGEGQKKQAINDGLRNLLQLVADSTDTVEEADNILDEDNETEGATSNELFSYRQELGGASALVTRLQQNDALDFLFIGGGFMFFMCCVFYVLAKRLRILGLWSYATDLSGDVPPDVREL